MAYESITKFAGLLEKDPGSMSEMTTDKDGVLQLPHYTRSEVMKGFEQAFYDIDLIDKDYIPNLDRAGIDPGTTDASSLDVSHMDAAIVLTILTKCVRSERFCEGALLSAAESGLLDRCLYRLAEIDREDS